MHSPAHPLQRLAALFSALLLCAAMLASGAASASAQGLPAATPQDCLKSGNVWVYVTYSDGSVVANSCATDFGTGEAALKSAGVDVGKDAKGMICSLDKKPNPCPAKFNGQYWNYYTSTDGKTFTYSQKAADQSKPVKGSIEAWCYNKASEKSCTPKTLSLTAEVPDASSSTPSSSASPAASSDSGGSSSSTAWGVGIVAAVIVIGVVVYLVVRRRRN